VDADRGSQDAAEATRDAWLSLSPVAVDSKPWSSPTLGSRRKHMSLPANLPSLLRSGDPRSAENRRRHPSTGVRFADEVSTYTRVTASRSRNVVGRRADNVGQWVVGQWVTCTDP